MIEDIPLESVSDNPFNPRIKYEYDETKRLAASLRRNGQLVPIKVRRKTLDKFELVYGHRRVKAAKLLGWGSIKAEVDSADNESMLVQSLAENIDRKDLTDYERAKSFFRLAKEFNWSQDQIAERVGYSRSHVSNFIRMAELFDSAELASDQSLIEDLRCISEHHARFLARIADKEARRKMLSFVVRENASVRDLQRMFQKLRGWFDQNPQVSNDSSSISNTEDFEVGTTKQNADDIKQIQEILNSEFNSPKSGADFTHFIGAHAIGLGFSLYSSDAPFDRLLIENEAIERERNWYHSADSLVMSNLRNVRVQFISKVALATLVVDCNYSSRVESIRGTVVFLKRSGKWKILHEHWSERPGLRTMKTLTHSPKKLLRT
ncbi:MAG TPA: ParB/RepB/Spo0J family partition protein [Nitrososphaerales archaeon]|nr:ParB/RepB/Spo0J family partition protein [Nitrososphaerales archaeon]